MARIDEPVHPLVVRLRRQAGAAVVDNFFRGMSTAGRLHPLSRPERHGVDVVRDVPYGPRPENRLDVYVPREPAGPRPVVLYVHGGGFRILSKETHWVMALAFARRGFVVFNIDYRLAPRAPYPAALEDCCTALRWAADNAARHGGDPARVVLAGESAGANLVTGLAVASSYRRPEEWARCVWDAGVTPRAVIAACGMLQVSDPERFRRRRPKLMGFVHDRLCEVGSAYLGASACDTPGGLELADPLCVLEGATVPERPLPPFFAPVGTKDPLLDDTRRLAAALERVGGVCDTRYYPGEIHAFHALLWRENARRCWRDTFSFLERHVP